MGMLLLPDVAKHGLGSLCAVPTSCHPDLLFHSKGEFPALMQPEKTLHKIFSVLLSSKPQEVPEDAREGEKQRMSCDSRLGNARGWQSLLEKKKNKNPSLLNSCHKSEFNRGILHPSEPPSVLWECNSTRAQGTWIVQGWGCAGLLRKLCWPYTHPTHTLHTPYTHSTHTLHTPSFPIQPLSGDSHHL